MRNVYDILEERGLIAQATDATAIRELLGKEKVTFYIGFDATADSLHVGHFLQMVVMKHLQDAGHKPVALLGTGTTMVGDPSGKSDMRQMMTVEQIDYNAECFRRQMSKFIKFDDENAMMVRNGDWLRNLNYIEFLRDIGKHFSVNRMLGAECFKSRLESGLSFFEFNYMIMQSYDFLHLHKEIGCKMQLGGNDQWSNIIGGVELTRKITGDDVYGMTFTLLTTKEGVKMGKTVGGAVWLDKDKTTPYEFFQYWRNIDDMDVTNCLKLLTNISIEEIDNIVVNDGNQINAAKEMLAFELTKLVHSEEDAKTSLETAKGLFGGNASHENMPTTEITKGQLVDGSLSLLDLLIVSEICPSKGEGRRLIQQGGVFVDNIKVEDTTKSYNENELTVGIIIKKGKKVYHKIILSTK